MKPKERGWKEGVITNDLRSLGGTTHKKGSTVRYRRYKVYDDETMCFTGEYEWHYVDTNNYNLIRTTEFLINS